MAIRFDVVAAGVRRLFTLYCGANNYQATTSGGTITVSRTGPTAAVSLAVNPAAGDTVLLGFRASPTEGLVLYASVNGGAITTASNTTPAALVTVAAPSDFYLGTANDGSAPPDATYAALRFMRPGLTDAAARAAVLAAYDQPGDSDLQVWQFEGFTSTVPSWDDRLVKLGASYDYRAVGTAAAATPTQSTGQQTSGSVAVDSRPKWFLKDSVDATKDTQIDVIEEFPYSVPRRTVVARPLAGSRKVAIRSVSPTGIEGHLRLWFGTVADQIAKEAALRALQASDNDLWLQSPFGDLVKVALPEPISFSKHDIRLDATIAIVEV